MSENCSTSAVPPADEPRAGEPGVPTSRFAVGDHVDILAGRGGERTWRPGILTKVTRARATVRYRATRGQSEVRQTVPFHRVRRRTA